MSDWTDERVEQLKKLWQQGWSASQIAKELGATTRNAVIGKIHRLNLVARQSPKMTPPPGSTALNQAFAKSRAASFSTINVKTPVVERSPYMPAAVAFAGLGKTASPAAEPQHVAEPAPRSKQAASFGQVYNPFKATSQAAHQPSQPSFGALSGRHGGSQQCQWPVGDPRNSGFHFCCGSTVEGLPYCPEHAKLAYQPTAKSRRVSVGGDMHTAGTPDEREIMVRV